MHLALIEESHHCAFYAFADKSIFLIQNIFKKDVGGFAAQFTVDGMMFSAAHFKMCEPTGVEPVNAILAMRVLDANASPASLP